MSKVYLVWKEHPIGDFFLLKAFVGEQKAKDLVSKLKESLVEQEAGDYDYYVTMIEVEE